MNHSDDFILMPSTATPEMVAAGFKAAYGMRLSTFEKTWESALAVAYEAMVKARPIRNADEPPIS